jgi:serine protease AprX
MARLLITTRSPDDQARLAESGVRVLAEYPDAVLVDATDAQAESLNNAGTEMVALADTAVQAAGAQFRFEDAVAADEAQPVVADPNRVAYYVMQLVGPAKQEWLATVVGRGASLHGNLPGLRYVIGAVPATAAELANEPFVDAITPFRPAMKVSPELRPDIVGRQLDVAGLTSVDAGVDTDTQVEITVFRGESAEAVAGVVRAAGGTVLSTSPHSVVAFANAEAISELASREGVESILPHAFPEPTNDRAAGVMHVPVSRVFGTLTLDGAGQIVGIADSGIDTGVAATLHADLAGRVTIVSSPNQFGGSSIDPPPFDDGPADELGHGTHVAGSVAGNGAAAIAAGAATVPRGIAPNASVHFTAIGQRVTWNPAIANPPAPWGLYGIPADLNNLFTPAYTAGARLHTNSWGSSNSAANPNVEGSYNAQASQVDGYMATHRDALVLFSAGNNGRDTNADAQIDGDSVGTPGTAKNCLTVGASENDRPHGSVPTPGIDVNWTVAFGPRFAGFAAAGHVSDSTQGMALFSSRGPTDDGRRKPDVVAPGTNVLSARSTAFSNAVIGRPAGSAILWGDLAAADPLNGLYCWSGGTSMATPLVAGAAALIRQHLVTQRGHHQDGVQPSGALIKAFLVNGADPIAGQYPGEVPPDPNTVDGFGLVNLTESLTPGALGQTVFSDDPTLALSSLQTRTFSVQAINPALPMKITLTWTDPPSPVGVGGLQNQLSLQIAPPGGGAVIEGDVTAFPNPTNNVQRIVIAAPVAGTYEIRVRSGNVGMRSAGAGAPAGLVQDFALAASNVVGLSARPVSIATTIDTTGSMDFYGFMGPAKERAAQLVDFLRGGDRLSISEFSHRAAPPDGRTPYPIRTLTTFSPDWSDALVAVGGLHADGLTPIGAGLLAAWTQLSGEAPGRPRGIVLLSDGFNNATPDPATVLPSIPASVPIFAIALGPAASTPALMAISSSRPGGGYFALDGDEDLHVLHEIYASLQALTTGGAVLQLDTVSASAENPASTDVDVESGLDSMTFTASWDGRSKPHIVVTDPSGVERDAQAIATSVIEGAGHRHVRVAQPMAGTWRVEVRSKSKAAAAVTLSATAPTTLSLTASLTLRRAKRATILATVAADGVGIDDASVVARVLLPSLSQAELLAKHADDLARLKLPDAVTEPGLSKSQLQLVALAALAADHRGDPGGLYGRRVEEIKLLPVGGGRYTGDVSNVIAGTVRLDVIATGKRNGEPWQRHAQRSILLTKATKGKSKQ